MYARVTTIQIGPEGIEASIRYFHDAVVPEIAGFPGFERATLLVNRDDHLIRALSYWDTPGHLRSADGVALRLQQGLTDRVEGAEVVSVEVFEVAAEVTAQQR